MKKLNINLNKKQSESQLQLIKRHLKAGIQITPLEALNRYGCLRLGARIWDLQQPPHNMKIKKIMVVVGPYQKRVAQYRLLKPQMR